MTRLRCLNSIAILLSILLSVTVVASEQIVIATPDNWSSKTAPLQAYEKQQGQWVPLFQKPVRVQLGRNGSAWGRGIMPKPSNLSIANKREGDGKAPAGLFRLGTVFGHAARLSGSTRYPYNQVDQWDAWVDDVKNPFYNRHIEIDPKKDRIPPWFESQRMRLGDGAYKWMIEIRHNADPQPIPGAGSAIFFHIRRGAERYTSGCTALQEAHILKLIRWLDASKEPHYVLLPKDTYTALAAPWSLPILP